MKALRSWLFYFNQNSNKMKDLRGKLFDGLKSADPKVRFQTARAIYMALYDAVDLYTWDDLIAGEFWQTLSGLADLLARLDQRTEKEHETLQELYGLEWIDYVDEI